MIENVFEVEMTKSKVIWNLPLQIGFFVYQYAKLKMLQFHFDLVTDICPETTMSSVRWILTLCTWLCLHLRLKKLSNPISSPSDPSGSVHKLVTTTKLISFPAVLPKTNKQTNKQTKNNKKQKQKQSMDTSSLLCWSSRVMAALLFAARRISLLL